MAKLNTKIVMLEGEQGKNGTNIKSVEKSASDGLTDTYTITLTDGSKSSFNVTNGKGISSIEKASTSGLVDTYTITYNDGTTQNYTVNNGRGISSISKTGASGLDDIYTITLDDGSTSTFNVTNGKGIKNIEKTSTSGLLDTYTITYNDETTSTFTITNGKGADQIQTQIIPTESIEIGGETASKAYSVGDFLVLKDGHLYKVIKDIPKGTNPSIGDHIERDTLCEEIISLSEKVTYKDITSDVSIYKADFSPSDVTSISAMRCGENVKLFFGVKTTRSVNYDQDLFIGTIKGLNIRMDSTSGSFWNNKTVVGRISQDGGIRINVPGGIDYSNMEFKISFDLIVE